jgi:hypothetical protein
MMSRADKWLNSPKIRIIYISDDNFRAAQVLGICSIILLERLSKYQYQQHTLVIKLIQGRVRGAIWAP